MTRIDYRLERIGTDGRGLAGVADALKKLGAEGWQVATLDLTPGWTPATGTATVLLQRPVDDTEQLRRAVMPGA